MAWNYRLKKFDRAVEGGEPCEVIGFVEAHYDENGEVSGTTGLIELSAVAEPVTEGDMPVRPFRFMPIDEASAVDEIRFALEKMLEATAKPILPKDAPPLDPDVAA